VVIKLFIFKTNLLGIFEPLLLYNPSTISLVSNLSDNIKNGFCGFLYVLFFVQRDPQVTLQYFQSVRVLLEQNFVSLFHTML